MSANGGRERRTSPRDRDGRWLTRAVGFCVPSTRPGTARIQPGALLPPHGRARAAAAIEFRAAPGDGGEAGRPGADRPRVAERPCPSERPPREVSSRLLRSGVRCHRAPCGQQPGTATVREQKNIKCRPWPPKRGTRRGAEGLRAKGRPSEIEGGRRGRRGEAGRRRRHGRACSHGPPSDTPQTGQTSDRRLRA